MNPHAPSTPALRIARTIAAALTLALFAFAAPAAAEPAAKITICHATASVTNPYVNETIAAQAVVAAHIDHQHTEDIIPEFTLDGVTYSQNLDAQGLVLLANGCVSSTSSSSSTSTTQDETSTSASTTEGNTTEVPFFTSATALVAGLGGALLGTFLMLRRRL